MFRSLTPIILLFLCLVILPAAGSYAAVKQFEITVDEDPRANPVYFTSEQLFDLTGNEALIGPAVRLWQESDRPDVDPVVLVARNNFDGATPIVSFQLLNLVSRRVLAEDVIGLTLTDFEIFTDTKTKKRYLIGAGLAGDSAKLLRSEMGAARYEWLTLATGSDSLKGERWDGTVQFLANADYDMDGEPELFLYVTGRNVSPRKIVCVKPEPFRVVWEREVSSAVGPASFVVCPDSLKPQVLFTCYGPQSGLKDDIFDDRYGYLAAIGPEGGVKFAKRILAHQGASTLAAVDKERKQFVFYHNHPVGFEPSSDLADSTSRHWLSISDCNGEILKTIPVSETIRSIWTGTYENRSQPCIFLLGLSGVVSVYDKELKLLAQSNHSKLASYLGQIRLDRSEPPLTLFSGGGNLYLLDPSFNLQGEWGVTAPEVEPVAVQENRTTSILLSGSTHGGVMRVHYRSGWNIFVVNIQQHQELVLTVLFILTVWLVLTNFFRLRASSRLQAREKMLTAVFNNMQDGFYRSDLDGRILWASPSCSRLLGGDDNFDPVGMHARDFYVNPEKRQKLVEELARTGRVTDWPVELRRADGKIINVAANSNLYYDKNGNPAGVEGVFRDITNRLEMERALRLSEDQYRSLVESAGEAIFSVDRSGTYLFMNTIAAKRLGGTPEEMIGKTLFDAFPPEIAERQFKTTTKVFETGQGVVVESKTVLRGAVRDYNTSLQPIRNEQGEIVSVLGIARDLTELVQAQNRLVLQEEFVGSLMDSANSIILCIDGERKLAVFNRECERVSGLERDTVLFQPWKNAFAPLLGDDLAKFESWLDSSDTSNCETGLRTHDGPGLTLLWSKTPVRSPGGAGVSNLVIGQDISQRKEVETALNLSVSRYRLLVENVGATVSLIDAKGVFHFINADGAARLGVTTEEVVGMNLHEVFPSPMAESQRQIVVDVLTTGREFNGEVLTSISGEWFWFQSHVQAYPEEFDGEQVAIVIAHDITKRKRAEESLRASEEKYRGIFDESVAAVFIFDNERRFVDANQSGLSLLGYSREQLLTMSISAIEAEPGSLDATYESLLEGGRLYNAEHRLTRQDGRIITVLNNSRPLTDLAGRATGIQSTLIDITDRKRAEETLRHRLEIEQLAASISTEFLTLAPDEVDAAISEALERVGRFVRAERGFMLRLSSDRSGLHVTHHWHAPEVEPVTVPDGAPSEASLQWWLGKLRDEKFLVVKASDRLPANVEAEREFFESARTKSRLAVPLKSQGEVSGSLNFSTVVEERDWPIEDIRMLNVIGEVFVNALEQKRKTEEVDRVNQARLEQERQIAGGFAHELRNALFPARNMLDRLLGASGSSMGLEERENYSRLIEASLNRASDIVGSILSYTRLGSQKHEEGVNIGEVVNEVLDATRLAIESAGVRVSTSGEGNLVIRSNRRQLFMVINNIVINALDAMETTDIPVLKIEWFESNASGVLKISDNGCGMSPETLKKLYEPFYSTKPDKGTGLGLATVRKIVTLFNGSIEVASELDKGSTFLLKHDLMSPDHG